MTSLRARAVLLAVGMLLPACGVLDDTGDRSSAASTAETASDATTEAAGPATDGSGAKQSGATGPSGPGSLTWGPCAEHRDLECATLEVPADHRAPDGDQLSLAVARARATGPASERLGSIVTNPGGPGGSGVESLADQVDRFPDELRRRFDLVSFDPRGVGASTAVDCVDDLDDQVLVLADPADDTAWKAIVDDQVETVAACKQRSGELLVQVGTMNAARDMDLLRDALGDERLTYVGFSYGTRLGAAYAELFPQRTRALVLDGAVKPDPRLNALNEAQTRGFEQAFANFARACDADADCPLAELGGADAAFRSVRQLIADGGPLKTADGRRLTEGEFYLGVLTALYVQEAWSALAYGLYVADTSANGWVLEQLSDLLVGRQDDGTYDNSNEANVAINCADDAERPSEAALRAESAALFTPGNHFGPLMGSDAGCLGWPAAIDSLQLGPATGAPPLLVIGTTGDPATPYEWAVELADFLDSGVLFTYEGEGHTAFLSGDCVEDVVVDYLVELALPAAPARCSDPERSADLFPKLR